MNMTPLYREGREGTMRKSDFCGSNTEFGLEPRNPVTFIPSKTAPPPLQNLWFRGPMILESAPNICCSQPCLSSTPASSGHTEQGVSALVDLDLCVIRLDGLCVLRLPGLQALEGKGGIVELRLILQGVWDCGKCWLFFLVLWPWCIQVTLEPN